MRYKTTDNLKIVILFLAFAVTVVLGFLIIGRVAASSKENERAAEQPHMYWKNISCEVEKKGHGLFSLDVDVYNAEYDIHHSFHLYGAKAKQLEELQEGDTVTCQMYSWAMEDTGEIVDRVLYDIVQ